ncbi:OsmC family protein [Paractinoplanes brasiliensis]|uniref:Putative OsmC-like protein n=1 Tax=Paractinoplanes brasiliensis TaxID=52695 RepID=A0A4R6JCI1_9ACTN|nr:OsmC family protein [Actinoplanes brasiliensis]TDO33047.1 putative OsmC-like protein [Actinoplanes brasiliensis]
MTKENQRSVEIERTGAGAYEVRNVRGGVIAMGGGDDDRFTPVELLLAALGGCSGIDVDLVASRRAEPVRFVVRVRGDKIRDAAGENRMENLEIEFDLEFPEGADGDRARSVVPRLIQQSHDRLCTVTRTVERGSPVAASQVGE